MSEIVDVPSAAAGSAGSPPYPTGVMREYQARAERIVRDLSVIGEDWRAITRPIVGSMSVLSTGVPVRMGELRIAGAATLWLFVGSSGRCEDLAELSVVRDGKLLEVYRVPFPSDALWEIDAMLRDGMRHRASRDASDPLEVELSGGWCLRLALGLPGKASRRAKISVGPTGGEHAAFWILVPESVLEDVADLCEQLAGFREKRVEQFEREVIRHEGAPGRVSPESWAAAGGVYDRLVEEGCLSREEADEAMRRLAQGESHE